jgi:hypothetical protein
MARRGKVVHCKREFYDIYIGRGQGGEQTFWGNPFVIGKDGTREEVIQKYRTYVMGSEEHMKRISELEGKILGCWCSPAPCHGDVLVDLANKPDWGNDDLFWYNSDKKEDHKEEDDGLGYCVHCKAPTRGDGQVSS